MDRPKHPPGMPSCDQCRHALCLHGEDGCLVIRCDCWRTDDSSHTVASQ
ncbi:hypothetical protein J1770_gp61 [Gordonia phage EMoore]|uniref:Uncharacterized protein n=1 Tax=Gordonia phage EMoore TaxID=2656534 RepID=A0A649VU93_9CAUD|nr:hypothetical protein J1770_gp61 [Gordonia phage EMoore]QGJ95868.1 hypothetical protein SEA_EMOORE_61 [Gordonia phage EMoore]